RPQGLAVVEDVPLCGVVEADHVPHQRALAAAAVAHDHEDRPARDVELQVALDDPLPVGHRQVAHLDLSGQMCTRYRRTVKMASAITTQRMPVTTALVVA